MLENIKKILQIQTVEQTNEMYDTKTLTFTFHHYWGAFLSGSFCPRGFFLEGIFALDPDSPFL